MMRRIMMGSMVMVAGSLTACAGGVSGEIDGKSVPSFGSAAFGGVEDISGTDVFALIGFAVGNDACGNGAALNFAGADQQDAERRGDIDDLTDALEDQAEITNDVVPIDSWFSLLTFIGRDIDDVREETFDVEDQGRDNVSIALVFCLQEDEASVETEDGIPFLDSGAQCFSIGEGELTFALNDDDSKLRVYSEDEVEAQFDDGDKAGDVKVDITFEGCTDIADSVEAIFEARTG